MMVKPSVKHVLLLILSGALASFFWLWLFGLWAIYDTPLLQLGFRAGLGARSVNFISSLVFCLLTAAMFAVPLRLFCRALFLVASAIFIAAFVLVFFFSALLYGHTALLLSFWTLWLFILLFAACVVIVRQVHHA